MFGAILVHVDIFTSMPVLMASAPKYAPHDQTAIAVSVFTLRGFRPMPPVLL